MLKNAGTRETPLNIDGSAVVTFTRGADPVRRFAGLVSVRNRLVKGGFHLFCQTGETEDEGPAETPADFAVGASLQARDRSIWGKVKWLRPLPRCQGYLGGGKTPKRGIKD